MLGTACQKIDLNTREQKEAGGLETEVMVVVVLLFSSAYRVQHVNMKQRNSPNGDLARRKAKKKV